MYWVEILPGIGEANGNYRPHTNQEKCSGSACNSKFSYKEAQRLGFWRLDYPIGVCWSCAMLESSCQESFVSKADKQSLLVLPSLE